MTILVAFIQSRPDVNIFDFFPQSFSSSLLPDFMLYSFGTVSNWNQIWNIWLL